MSLELVISSTQKGNRIALLENKKLVEYHNEEAGNSFTVGDLYLGKVQKVFPGNNAAFVDIGHQKDAFLHYHDLGPNVRSLQKWMKEAHAGKRPTWKLDGFKLEKQIDKHGKINQVLNKNQLVVAQVVKEPISNKGPKLSSEISIAGRYLVLVPFTNSVSVSKRINSKEERSRLVKLIKSIKPANFGVIIRTVAQGKEVAELDNDLRHLMKKWEKAFHKIQNAKPSDKIMGEMGRASSILRDMLNEKFDSIIVDDDDLYMQMQEYMKTIAPDKLNILRLHRGRLKLFEQYGIEKQIKATFGKSVSLQNGGYLIIEHTEAMHVIDVNSGNMGNASGGNQESTALEVNTQAAKEIARQLRLRDLGGIVVVDFVDMRKADNRRKVNDLMKKEMKNDRSRHTVLGLSKFNLMQITRQRVRPELNITTQETCPTCGGTGKISASIVISDQIINTVEGLIREQNEKGLTITLHPYLYAFFTKGVMSQQMKWFLKYKTWVNFIQDSSLGLTEYFIRNKSGQEVQVA